MASTPAGSATCTFDDGVLRIILAAGDSVSVTQDGDAIVVEGATCVPAPSVEGSEAIEFVGQAGEQTVTLDLSQGALASTVSGALIPIDVGLGAGDDRLVVLTGDGDDVIAVGTEGLNRNASGSGDEDVDVFLAAVDLVELRGGAGADTLRADGERGTGEPSAFPVLLDGGPGDDPLLAGGLGDDMLVGGPGSDTLIGGAGSDTASFAGSSDPVVVELLRGTALGQGADTLASIENVVGSESDDHLVGDDGDNVLRGLGGRDLLLARGGDDVLDGGEGIGVLLAGDGDDRLTGGGANDLLDGGDGDDTLDLSRSDVAVNVDLTVATAQNTNAGSDVVLGVEHVVGSAKDDVLKGDDGNNKLHGGPGDDVVQGRGGDDLFDGGEGGDRANFDSIDGVKVDLALSGPQPTGEGSDTLIDVEDLLGGEGADELKGDAGANTLDGGSGDDVLVGRNGEDVLVGRDGKDRAEYGEASGAVVVDLQEGTATGSAGEDTLQEVEDLVGSPAADSLTGNAHANRLDGGGGDDVLDGRAGDDELHGGEGKDRARYADAPDPVEIDLNVESAQDTKGAGRDLLAGIEDVEGSRYEDKLIGNASGNVLLGGGGDDVLLGKAGPDRLDGQADNDELTPGPDDDGDVVAGGDGLDRLNMSASTVPLSVNLVKGTLRGEGNDATSGIEDVETGSAADDIVGDRHSNRLVGGRGNDVIEGGGGLRDEIDGGPDKDVASYAGATVGVSVDLAIASAQFTVGAGSDVLRDVEGLLGSQKDDTLIGDGGDNAIEGSGGYDILEGRAGADVLVGGADYDMVSYASAATGVRVSLSITGPQNTRAAGVDVISGLEALAGSSLDDVLIGDGGANVLLGGRGNDVLSGAGGHDDLYGESGNDTLAGRAGDDVLSGGSGADVATFAASPARVVIDLSAAIADGDGADSLTGIEIVHGSRYADVIGGNSRPNVFYGKDGNDRLLGRGGNDTLYGQNGNDSLDGGSGTDACAGGAGADTTVNCERLA